MPVGDPHFISAHGDNFDFKGKNNTVYNMLSHANISANALFRHADFHMGGKRHKLVHGSYMHELYATVKTSKGSELHVLYAASQAMVARINVVGKEYTLSAGPEPFKMDDVVVTLKDRTIQVATPMWTIQATSRVNPQVLSGQRTFLSVSVSPHFDADHALVAPHGLLGQAYDGDTVKVQGATDSYARNETTTSAMGEGAIEGVAKDYEITGDKFATAFAFSRFGKTSAAPRDATKLTGRTSPSDQHLMDGEAA